MGKVTVDSNQRTRRRGTNPAGVAIPPLLHTTHKWDFSNVASVTSGSGLVTAVADLVGSANMTTAGGSVDYPSGTQNGLNYARNQSSNTVRMDAAIGSISQPLGIMLVSKDGSTVGGVMFDYTVNSGSGCGQYNGSGNKILDAGGTTIAAATNTSWHVWYFELNGASSKIYKDGSLIVTGSAGTNGMTTGFRIFNNRIPNGGSITNSIGEVWFQNSTESSTDIIATQTALKTKWGI